MPVCPSVAFRLIRALSQILPAVKQANFKIIVGVWPANGVRCFCDLYNC
jgi:exo-beta-1,3-glucanase (GH17 family)